MALRREKKKVLSRQDILNEKTRKLLNHPSVIKGKNIAKISNLPKLTQKQIDEASKAGSKEAIQQKLKEEMAKIKAKETAAAVQYLGADAVEKIKKDRLEKNRQLLKQDLALKKKRQQMFEKRKMFGSSSDEDDYSSEDEDLGIPADEYEAIKNEEKEGGYLSSFQNWLGRSSATGDAAKEEAEQREKQAKINKAKHDALIKQQEKDKADLKAVQDRAAKLRKEKKDRDARRVEKEARELKAQQEKDKKEREKKLEQIKKAKEIEEERQAIKKRIEDERKRQEEERKRQAEEKEAQRIALENEQKKLQQEAEAAKAKEVADAKAKEVADAGESPEDRFIAKYKDSALATFYAHAGQTWTGSTNEYLMRFLKAFASDPYSGDGVKVTTQAARAFLYGKYNALRGNYEGVLRKVLPSGSEKWVKDRGLYGDVYLSGDPELDKVERMNRKNNAMARLGDSMGLGDKMIRSGTGKGKKNQDIIVRHILSQRMTDVFVKAGITVASLAPSKLKRQVAQAPVVLEKPAISIPDDGFTTPDNQRTKPRNKPPKRKGRQLNLDPDAGSGSSSSSSSGLKERYEAIVKSGDSKKNQGPKGKLRMLAEEFNIGVYNKDNKTWSKKAIRYREAIEKVIAAGGSSSTPTRNPSPIRSATLNEDGDSDTETVILDDDDNQPESSSGGSDLDRRYDEINTNLKGREKLTALKKLAKDMDIKVTRKSNTAGLTNKIKKKLNRLFNDDFADIKAYFEKPDNPSHLLAVNKFHLRENEELDEELVMQCSRREHEAPAGVMDKEMTKEMTKEIKKKRVERVDPPLLKI